MSGHKVLRGKGVWTLFVSNGFDANGNRIRPTRTFKGSEHAADMELSKFFADVKRDEYEKPSKMITKDLFRKWLDTYGKVNLKTSTQATFERYLINRVAPMPIGTVQVKKLTTSDFYELYGQLKEKYNYSGKTLLQIHRIMHSAFTEALGWPELKLRSNPMLGVKAPKAEIKAIKRLKDDEVSVFLNTARKHSPEWFYVYLCVDFLGGLRRSEICGLRWGDIRQDKKKIYVWRNVVREKQKGLKYDTPKSGKYRVVSAPKDLFDVLEKWKLSLLNAKGPQKDDDLIFATRTGKPKDPDEVSHYLKEFREKHGLPDVTVHGGRHSNATMLINKGATLKEVSSNLGHSTTQITDAIYTEVWEERKTSIADSLNGIITGPGADEAKKKGNKKIVQFPPDRIKSS
ncbi:MAG TPA: hypothetical protein DIT32_03630 [Peptococcaceae bacterium]|nr:hypothetical protein [Peptococcaceae bacterium]